MSSCIAAKRWRAALDVFAELQSDDVAATPDKIAYDKALVACSGEGLWKDALQLLSEMSAANNCQPNSYSYFHAADACEKAGQQELDARLRARAKEMRASERPSTRGREHRSKLASEKHGRFHHGRSKRRS